jgi:uncharacterized membrane protein
MCGVPLFESGSDAIEARVTIQREIVEVYRFYRDFRNLPRFLGDVMAVELIDPVSSRWLIQGPLGMRVSWTIRVTVEQVDELICYETVSLPALKTRWVVRFGRGADSGETEVSETMQMPLGGFGRAALALIGKFPGAEVAANLRRLKEVLETGCVTDTSYSVPGKFAGSADPCAR